MASIALVTCEQLSDLDEEGQLLAHSLRSAGVQAEAAVWSDPEVDWARFDLVVVRSAWDYTARRTEFLQWARSVAQVTRLANPPQVLEWNSDKHYLLDLEAAGLPVVPTHIVEPSEWEPGTPAPTHRFADEEHVIKPAVGAGSLDAGRHQPGEASQTHLVRLLDAGRAAVAQPYLHQVDSAGETAMVFLGGEFAHALRKAPLLAAGGGDSSSTDGGDQDLFVPEKMTAREPSPQEQALAARAIEVISQRFAPAEAGPIWVPLYARVDLLPSEQGPVILELELTEPSLFLHLVPSGAPAMVEAIRRFLSSPAV